MVSVLPFRSVLWPAVAVCSVLAPLGATAAPVLTSAEAQVRFLAPLECEVTLTVAITGATADIEHRLELLERASFELRGLERAAIGRAPHHFGRTSGVFVTPATAGAPYVMRYRVLQAPSRPGRCPIWLPTVTTDGRSREVRLTIDIPDGHVASGTMPTFAWRGTHGTAVLPHLPAFVIVPFGPVGQSRPWDISRVMDIVAVVSIAVASVLWLRRGKGAQ